MRTKLGRLAALAALAVSVTTLSEGTADAQEPPVDSTTTTTEPAATEPTTTTTVVPLVGDVSGAVTPGRGTPAQVTDTLPPPPTTTTLPATALPDNSGEGRRVVYSKTRQRVWTVEEDGTVSKTHLVSGRRTWNQPLPGTYRVFSRSSFTCNIKNPAICWRFMVRFTVGPEGDNIGLHEIPKKNGVPVQTESQLGTPLSGGCVRQATSDAIYMWNWAPIGTKVVVLG